MKFKKITAVVSALCMLCAVPFLPEQVQKTAVISANAEASSGTCGDNLTWILDIHGTLKISGTGTFVEQGFNTIWSGMDVKNLIIEEGLTETAFSFMSCSALSSVQLPESLEVLGTATFASCNNLKRVLIPAGVKTIGSDAFAGTGLTVIIIKSPDCEIIDGDTGYTLGSAENTVIHGYVNSTAQAYAEKYGYQFEALEESMPGDVDGNGTIDILDVITVNRALLGKEFLTETQVQAVDFNGNGKPDADETLTIMRYIVGLITSFTE
ncbi:MAG: hypothetical protein E7496_03285 [Ruminococcus sp.]|nr:hypothetical protein [Ruminococcus sp.]